MSDWLLNLPVLWMTVVVFAATYLFAQYLLGSDQARGERSSASIQGGLARNAAAIGHPFRPVGWLHRR